MTSHVILMAAAACALGSAAGLPDGRVAGEQARIAIDRGAAYTVQAFYDGASPESLTYRLEVVREGTGGRSQSAQGGAFEATAGRTDTLSTVRVSVSAGDRFEAHLVVRRGDVVVSETRVEETVQ